MRASDLETLSGAGRNRKGMLKQSENIVHRLFNRQITRSRPNTHIHQARTLYENIVPSHTLYDVECPDQTFRKFTNDGQYLIGFSRNYQDLVVYRHRWLNFGVKGDAAEQLADLPPRSNKFQSHFSLLYTIPLASGSEAICKDFFLSTENGLYGIFATSSVPDTSNPPSHGAVPGVPSTEKITIFLVSFAEGRITDERSFRDDFIHLAHNMGVFLYDDLLAILSIRFQCIRILQVRETGRFVDVRTIGQHCREDDELVLNSQAQEEVSYHKQLASLRKGRGLSQHDVSVAAGNKSPEQGKPWPPLWNVKQPQHGQGPRRERNRRQQPPPASAHGSNTAAELSGHPARSENNGHGDGSADPDANSDGDGIIPNEIHEADLDVQYENYFRGLLASLEDTAVNQMNSSHVVVTDGPRSTAHAHGELDSMNTSEARLPPEATAAINNGHHHVGGIDPPQQNGSGNNSGGGLFSAEKTTAAPTPQKEENGIGSSSQFSAERTIAAPTLQQTSARSMQNSGGGGVDLRSAYEPLDSIHPDRRNPEGGSTSEASSGGGGHHLSAGPSRFGRSSYTSTTSGSSLDRYTSGRGSSSLRYTSTTISSDSDSQSHRRDFSFSGGSMSFGNGRAAGSVSVQSENGNFVEYVVSRRGGTAVTTSTTQQAVPPEERQPALPSSSFQGGGSDRRGFRVRENGWTFPGEGGGTSSPGNGGNPSHEGHNNNNNNTDMPDADDRNLPSGSVDRSTTSVTTTTNNNNTNHRAEVNVNARPAPVSVRESNNGNGNWNNRPRPPRDGDNGNAPGGGGGAVPMNRLIGSASPGGNEVEGTQVLGGIKQRLLSFIFQGVVNDHISPATKGQRLKRFYYHFQHYVDLVMWKVQFLDRYHLLIKFGSVDGVLQRNSDTSHQTAFLAIFNLETTEMLGFYQNSSDEFLLSFEQFCDHFRVAPRYPLYMNFISSYSNNSHVREQLRKQRLACNSSKAGNYSQVVKRTLAWVPFNAQCQSPSPYFDQSLFHYDEKLISAIDRHKPCMEHPIKFLSRRRPNCLKFKLSPGPEHGASDGRTKRVASFIFHPIFPFAISIQQSYMQPSIINFHFRK